LSEAEAKAKNYYISCLDVDQTIETLGEKPLFDLIHEQFKGWSVNWNLQRKRWDLQDTLEKIHALGMCSFFCFSVGKDEKQPTRHILKVMLLF